jgi:DNA-binding NarL/FixJ family response regulator
MIRVAIKASSRAVRVELESLLRSHPSIRIVEEVSVRDAADADGSDDLTPDVVVAQFQDQQEANESSLLDDAEGGAPIVLLASGPAAGWLRQGVRAVLPIDALADQIAAAIEAAAAGLIAFSADEVESFPAFRSRDSAQMLPEPLTVRENEVLRFMSEGLGNKEIVSKLKISEHTVKFHVASVMGKLGATSRTEAVTMGIRRGIVLV